MEKFQSFLVGLLVLALVYLHISNYSFEIKLRWGIEVPKVRVLYNVRTEASFNGDGVEYIVLDYKKDISKSKIDWKNGRSSYIEECIPNFLEQLEIDEKYLLDFQDEYMYYLQKKEDSSHLVMIYVPNQQRIYIVEFIC